MNANNNAEIIQVLKEAKAVIQDPKNWIKGCSARNDIGISVVPHCKDAVCFCVIGAVRKVVDSVYSNNHTLMYDVSKVLNNNVRFVIGMSDSSAEWFNGSAPCFNDRPSTTHEDIMKLFDHAISSLEKEEGG